MANDTIYTPVNDQDEAVTPEEISNILRNPTTPDRPKIYSGTGRIVSLLAAIVLVAISFYVLVYSISRKGDVTTDIAYDPRLEQYQSPGNAGYCAEWPLEGDGAGLHLSTVAFELPSTFDLLFFLSHEPAAGHLNIVKNPVYSSKTIEVNVTARYHKPADLQRTKVCRMGHQTKNEHGILIWAQPRHPHHGEDPVIFNITVALPQSVRGYGDVSTSLPAFSHKIDDFFDLWSPTAFGTIRLKTSHAPVDYGALVCEAGFVQTNDAQVVGFFAAAKSVNIRTSNALIRSISMIFPQSSGYENEVHIHTSNAPVDVFMSVDSDYAEPKLKATIRTSNGGLNVTLPRYASVNSSFYLDASTTNAPSIVRLNSGYEGTYDLETSVVDARIVEDPEARDPSGKGRQRTLERTSEGHRAQGSIYWSYNGEPSPEGRQRGSVRVRNSNQPITMYLGMPPTKVV